MPSEKIKIGIKCLIANLDSPQKTNNANGRHWRYFFIFYIILGFQKKSKQASSVRFQSLTAHKIIKTPKSFDFGVFLHCKKLIILQKYS